MRTFFLCSTLFLAVAASGSAAPNLSDKPKWEYAELTYRTLPAQPAYTDADGKEVAAVPVSVSIRWVTGAGEVEVKGWDSLAEKLKVTGFKKGSESFQRIQILNSFGADGWELMEEHPTMNLNAGFGGMAGAPGGGGAAGGRGGAAGLRSVSLSPGTSTWLLKRRVP